MLSRWLRGALAGLSATVPMSALMEAGAKHLQWHERYPLPPRLITKRLGEKAGVRLDLDDPATQALTLAAHFGYGAAMGAVYGALVPPAAVGPASGVAFGLGVWGGSYLGLLPAAQILSSATEHPPRRTALMIAAHVVWGAALGKALQAIDSQSEDGR